jgi:hypothetical protein
MGVVYKALHVELGKLVALKILLAERMDDVMIARFKNEIRAIGKLDHPNIVGTHDAGQLRGIHFLVMAYVDGTDVARLLEHHGRLSIADACEIIRQAADGLQHALERGLVHRDIKPSNLLLARDGIVKVLDLGIARSLTETPTLDRLTAAGMLLGTVDYLAPEQWEHPHLADARADVYSLGCTLFHLITGSPPFAGPEYRLVVQKMRAHLDQPVPSILARRPDVPAALASVLEQMLAKNPDDRLATPGETAEQLRRFAVGANLTALLDLDERAGEHPSATSHVMAAEAPTLIQQRDHLADGSKSVPGGRTKYRFAWLLTSASLALALCVASAVLLTLYRQAIPTEPVRILAMQVGQYRGQSAQPLGEVGMTAHEILSDDAVRVAVDLSRQAYCYLIAFNPDGSEQLCFPEDPDMPAVMFPEDKDRSQAMTSPPAPCTQLRYPREQYFEPGLGGLQTFVLIASTQPLPPYATWRSTLGSIPWSAVAYQEPWRWQFDGRNFKRLPSERGTRVQRGVPREFAQLCRFLQTQLPHDAVQAIAFPVAFPRQDSRLTP